MCAWSMLELFQGQQSGYQPASVFSPKRNAIVHAISLYKWEYIWRLCGAGHFQGDQKHVYENMMETKSLDHPTIWP